MYRSMLSDVLPLVDEVKVGKLRQVVYSLKGVFLSRPQRKMLVPEWDLPLVLRVFEAAPLEPMELVSLKLVTFKFTFLLMLITARRVADISKFGDWGPLQGTKGEDDFSTYFLSKSR